MRATQRGDQRPCAPWNTPRTATSGVDALPEVDKAVLLDKVRNFNGFNADNDPHGEHDFVDIEHDGEKYFAKLDYYAADMEGGSEDPSDPSKTVRVLTIMRADEY
jgi:Protein of unknown function (DUF3768)